MDNTDPTVAVSYGGDTDPFRDADTLTITASITDESEIVGTPQVTIDYNDGFTDTGAMTEVNNKEWTYIVKIPAGNDGTAQITVAALDAADNSMGAHSSHTFEVDNTAPTVDLTYDDAEPFLHQDTVTVTATFTDVSAIAGTPQIAIAYAGGATDSGAMTQISNKIWTYDIEMPSGNDGTAPCHDHGPWMRRATRRGCPRAILLRWTTPSRRWPLAYNDTDPFRDGDTVTVTATFTDASDIAGIPQIAIALCRRRFGQRCHDPGNQQGVDL